MSFRTSLLSARENILNNFKSKIFLTKNPDQIPTPQSTVIDAPKPIKEQTKKSSSKLKVNFLNKISNDEKI